MYRGLHSRIFWSHHLSVLRAVWLAYCHFDMLNRLAMSIRLALLRISLYCLIMEYFLLQRIQRGEIIQHIYAVIPEITIKAYLAYEIVQLSRILNP